MYKVLVLLSTYNGEKYIDTQIISILNQKNVEVNILVRDDGSKDNTLKVLSKFGNRISIIEGENKGVFNSFYDLIDSASEYDYYAFADQDDVWDEDKLIIAINRLHPYVDIPAIYSSNTRLVDKDLQFVRNEIDKAKTNLGSALVKNYVTGCTCVFNYQLFKQLRFKRPNNILYHDWWANVVALSLGGVSVYDYTPHISYRQHDSNVVGADNSVLMKMKRRWRKFTSIRYRRDLMAAQLLEIYADKINPEERVLLESLTTKKNFKIIFNKKFRTVKVMDNILFAICVITNRI